MSAEMGALVTWLGSGFVTLGGGYLLARATSRAPDAHPGPTMTGGRHASAVGSHGDQD
jgi:hypothetical protein